jgi:hypothetical protein
MPVTTVHPEYSWYLPMWQLTRDAVKGGRAISLRDKDYLPAPFRESDKERYAQYKARAYFMGVTGRTEKTMIGMVYRKPSVWALPPALEALLENIDGAGNSLEQVCKDATKGLLETRRHLLLVDYPQAAEGLDAETERALDLRPLMLPYVTESLINWKIEQVNGKRKLTLAVLAESVECDENDEFDHDVKVEYLVLRLRDGIYTQQRYSDGGTPKTDEFAPRMAGGLPFDHIPLHGVRELETPPLFAIAEVNIAHYRNVADLEDAAYAVGQPMLHVNMGETSADVWNTQNPDGVMFGSRKGIVTQKGSIELVQAAENNLIKEIKTAKEQEMVMLGAQLIQRGGQAETAEAARIGASAEASALDTLVNDLSEDVEAALEDMGRFMGVNPETIEFKLNTSFFDQNLDAQTLTAIIQARDSGTIAQRDVLHMVRSGKIQIEEGRTDEQIAQDVAGSLLDG